MDLGQGNTRSRAPSKPGSSIAWTLLSVILVTSLLVSGSGILVAALAFWTDLENQQLIQLENYVDERGRRNAAIFDTVERAQATAIDRFERRLEALSDDEVNQRFDALFPARPDGTRRSRDDMFDGYHDEQGNYRSGVGAYLHPPGDFSPLERRQLVSAYEVVDSSGQALTGLVDNFYYFTFRNELVISAASREDQLQFYRHEATADFEFTEAAFVQLMLPANNPSREFLCGELTQLIYVRDEQSLTTGCYTPYDADGVPTGAFGTTIQLHAYFEAAMAGPPAHGVNILLDQAGQLIAHPDLIHDRVTDGRIDTISAMYNLPEIAELLLAEPATRTLGTLISRDGRWVVAYSRLQGPGWFSVSLVDRNILRRSIAGKLSIALGLGILGVALQAVLAYFILYRRFVRPLEALTGHFGVARPRAAATNPALEPLLGSRHEIGILARTLEEQRATNKDAFDLLEARVAERTRELEAANQAKSTFLANISHEIRTPLNGILGLAQVLRTTSRSKKRQDQARMIKESGETLTQLLNDVLDMSKIEAGKMELSPQVVDPARLIEDMHTLFQASAEAKSLEFSIEIDPSLPERLQFDPLRVRQCLSNLLSNAIKFTSKGSVRLCVNWHGEADRAGLLEIRITDTGIGIPPEKLATLFSPFTQSDAAIAGEFGGTGLGLSIARDLAQLMGGDITAEATPGQGSTFTLTFTAKPAQTKPATQKDLTPTQLADDPGYAGLLGLRVLLVEDNDINRQVVQAFMAPLKVHVTEAENGLEALAALEAAPFDIVLMDVRMPILDGLEATRRLRDSDAPWRDIPVTALTANASHQDADICLAAGMDSFASKPLKPASLFGAMRRARQLRPYSPA
ncbi:ATP-binding protein [Maricaulis sp.]|uniref:ATP-binding protein n=1 Tax=Maricaulis sp. TaxID=1486257 RepID=UPI003A919ADC